jgi:phenylacetate-CoA ligase
MIHRLFNSYLLYPLAERFEGRAISPKLTVLREHGSLPFSVRRRDNLRRLTAMLHHAGTTVPYYRDLFAETGFDPGRVEREPEYLERLPFLTKDIMRREGPRLLNEPFAKDALHQRKTGGSTGPSTIVYYSQEALDWTAAVNRHVLGWTGKKRHSVEIHLSTRFFEPIALKARIKERVKCWALNRVNVFTDSFDERGLDAVWRKIARVRPFLVHGHPSTLVALARHVSASGHAEHRAFEVFESTGETLDEKQRDLVEAVFGCRVVNRFGNAEFGVVAYEERPSDRGRLSMLDFMVWPETVVTADGSSEIVFTGLTNHAMPLIRYRTGDLGVVDETPDGLILTGLQGRIHDVVTLNGRPYPTHFVQDLLDRLGGIAEFQLVERSGDRTLLRLVPEPGESHDRLRAAIRSWWGDSVEIRFVEWHELERIGNRGKFSHLVRHGARSEGT